MKFSWKFLTKISEYWLKLSDLAGIYAYPTCFAKCSCKFFYSKRIHCSMPQTRNQFLSRPLIFTLKVLVITGWLFCGLSLSVGLCPYDSTVVLYLWQKDHRSDMFSGRHAQVPVGWWSNQRFFCFIFRWNLGKTYNIVLGFGQVVLGMDMGLREMCVGEKRTVIIPPHLGYGEAGVGESVVEKASGTWSLFVFCVFWCSKTICFFHLKPQPRKSVVFIQVFSIFISKPHEFGVSAMLMGLSRGFCGKKKKQTLNSSNPHVGNVTERASQMS